MNPLAQLITVLSTLEMQQDTFASRVTEDRPPSSIKVLETKPVSEKVQQDIDSQNAISPTIRALGTPEIRLMIIERCDFDTLLNLVKTFNHGWSYNAAFQLWTCPERQLEAASTGKLRVLTELEDFSLAQQYAKCVNHLAVVLEDNPKQWERLQALEFPDLTSLLSMPASSSMPPDEESKVMVSLVSSSSKLDSVFLRLLSVSCRWQEFCQKLKPNNVLSFFFDGWRGPFGPREWEQFRQLNTKNLWLTIGNPDCADLFEKALAQVILNPHLEELVLAIEMFIDLERRPASLGGFQSNITLLKVETVDALVLRGLLPALPLLKSLRLTTTDDACYGVLDELPAHCPHLKHLTFHGTMNPWPVGETVSLIAQRLHSMETIDCGEIPQPTWAVLPLYTVLEHGQNLKVLAIHAHRLILADIIYTIGQACPTLEILRLNTHAEHHPLSVKRLRKIRRTLFPKLKFSLPYLTVKGTKECCKDVINFHFSFPFIRPVCQCNRCCNERSPEISTFKAVRGRKPSPVELKLLDRDPKPWMSLFGPNS